MNSCVFINLESALKIYKENGSCSDHIALPCYSRLEPLHFVATVIPPTSLEGSQVRGIQLIVTSPLVLNLTH